MTELAEHLGRLMRAVSDEAFTINNDGQLSITLRHLKSGEEVTIPGYVVKSTCQDSADRSAAPCNITFEHRGESNFKASINFAAVFKPTAQEDLMAELHKQTSLMTATDLGHLLRIVRNLGA